jgi:MazG-like family
MPQNDLDEVTGRTTDGVSRAARYLQIFDTIFDSVQVGDYEGARLGWAALPLLEALSEGERREIERPLIHKFDMLSCAYAAAPSPPDDRWKVGSPAINVQNILKLCESVTNAFGNYMDGSGFDAKQLAAEVPMLIAESTRAETQVSISQWAEATFGPSGSNARAVARANREMSELLEHVTADDRHPGAAEEVADIVIVLYRIATRLGVDLHPLIDAKMAKNRARTWRLDGTGHGYHVEESGRGLEEKSGPPASTHTHVLWNGAALCTLRGLPKDWPPGHRWISFRDATSEAAPVDYCKRCWDILEKVVEQFADKEITP